jgi:sugar lactone lactonase YvrE
MSAEVSVVIDGGHFYEGPRWHEDRLWVSDFYGHQVISATENGAARVEATLPNQPSGLGWLPDGRLLVVSMLDQLILRREHSGELVEHADLSGYTGGHLINDMWVDSDGTAYVSTFSFNPFAADPLRTAPVVMVGPDGSSSVAATDFLVPNGIVPLPGSGIVVAETMGQCLTAFDRQPSGELTGRRVWAAFGPRPVSDDVATAAATLSAGPDGISVPDADGAIWVADSFGSRVIRVREGGEILDEIRLAHTGTYACALGGADGSTLFICTAPDFDAEARSAAAEAQVLAVKVAVPAEFAAHADRS